MKVSTRKVILDIVATLPLLLLGFVAYTTMMNSNREGIRIVTIFLLIIVIVVVMVAYMFFHKKWMKLNKLLFLTITLSTVASISFLMQDVTYLYMPIMVGVMLVAIVIDEQLAIVMHLGLVSIVGIVVGQGIVFFSYYIILGIVAALIVNYAKERTKVLIVALALSLFSGLYHTLLAYTFYDMFSFTDLLLAIGNSALALIIVIGSLPLWETIFKVMTPLKLLEFSNTNHKLLQRLLVEAPGTYHHVQMVSSLAERGAKAIEADALLAKTGALFHDIGKLKEPLYFIENQNGGPNPHDEIAAEDSVRIIIEHVNYGVKLANEHKLPTVIVDMIKQHHGTSVVKYFYHKAVNYNDGVEYDAEDFSYAGPKPQTKEAVVIMLADCVEAFVRSLSESNRTLEKIEWIIGEVIKQKFEDQQLDESPLQVSELKVIGEAFMQVYNGLYHERIKYPSKG